MFDKLKSTRLALFAKRAGDSDAERAAFNWLQTVSSSVTFLPRPDGPPYVSIYLHSSGNDSRILGYAGGYRFLSVYAEARDKYEASLAGQAQGNS